MWNTLTTNTDTTYGTKVIHSDHLKNIPIGNISGLTDQLNSLNGKFGNYLPLSGGTLSGTLDVNSEIYASGRIVSNKTGGVWVQARDYASLYKNSYGTGSWNPILSMKTTAGDWSLGTLTSDQQVRLVYITDANYNADSNNITYELKFPAASGTIALTTDIPSTLPANGGTANFLGENKGSLLSAKYGNYGGILQDSTNGPRSGIWSNRIKILHSNQAGYYTELAQEFNGSENHLYFRELNNGSLSAWRTVWDSSNLTKVSQLTNDAGYVIKNSIASVVGDTNGYVSYYCNFPNAGNLVSLGYNTSDKINDDNAYFKGLCKWIGATYKNKEAILIGRCQPNSQGWCIIHKYPHENNSEGYPRYLTGTYQTYLHTYTFTIWEYNWYWNGGITATTLARNGDVSKPMTFNWYGHDGQPTWLWGGEDGTNMYVYNPKNFAVDTATRIYSGVSNDFKGAYSLYYTAGQFSATAGNGVVYKTTYYPTSATGVTSAGAANIMNLRLDWDSTHKYWHDIFASPNYNTLWHRSVIGGVSSSWYRIVQEDGGTYSITSNSTNLVAGYSPSRYVPNWGYYNYAETPGYLILTDIPVNTNTMFVAHIWGNSYSNYNLPLDLYIQGYTYSAKVFSSSVGMLSLGRWINKSYIFSYNGNVGIWIPHTGSFVSLYADIRITSGISTPNLNHCISITGSSKPSSGISDEVAIPMHCSIHYNEGTGGASLNSLAYNGYYYINEAASNYPTNTQNGHLLNLALSDTKTQLIIPYLSKGSMWYRGGSTSLGTWKQILDDNNYSNFALPLSGGKITGMLEIQADKENWREGIRIYPYNSWSTIVLGGNDLKSSSGTTTNTWSIHNNNGNFWIAKNGSDSNASAYMGHTNQWWFNDSITTYGSLNVAGLVATQGLEFSNVGSSTGHGGYIDFHYKGSTEDFTSRIIEYGSGKLALEATNVYVGYPSTSYALNVAGDSYVSGWSRSNVGFYIEGQGVYFTHQGAYVDISMNNGDEFELGSSNGNLYFGYRAPTVGKAISQYYWQAGSSASWANHKMGNIVSVGTLYIASTSTLVGAVSASSTISATGTIYSSTGIYSSGYVSARGQDTSSDINLKTDFSPIKNALDYVLKTHYTQFKWKDTMQLSMGIIAQEEENRDYGYLVKSHDSVRHLTYDYAASTALLGAAIQEEDSKVEALKRRVAELENEIKKLKEYAG